MRTRPLLAEFAPRLRRLTCAAAFWHTAVVGVGAASVLLSAGWAGRPTPGPVSQFDYLPPTYGKLTYYQPRKGESLFAIARKFDVSLRALSRANRARRGKAPLLIPALRFPPPGPPNGVVLNLAERIVYFYDETGRPVSAYPVAIGRVGWETPTGDFTIRSKARNPTWFPPSWAKEEEPVPPGPKNPLGDRWMGLSEPGYGLHATNALASVGRAASHGCLRMYPEDAHKLFGQVKRGTPVKIIYETVLLGYSAEERVLYLTIHPDIYNTGTNSLARARRMLRYAGLGELIEEGELARLVASADGLPVALLGSTVKLEINGAPVALPFGPTRRGDDYLVPAAALAAALEAGLQPTGDRNHFLLERGGNLFAFAVGEQQAWINQRPVQLPLAPRWLQLSGPENATQRILLLPLQATCEALGARVSFDAQGNRLQITDPYLPPRQALGLMHYAAPDCSSIGCASPTLDLPLSAE